MKLNQDMKSLKKDLRQYILEQNKTYSEGELLSFSKEIVQLIKKLLLDFIQSIKQTQTYFFDNAKLNVASFKSISGEPDLELLHQDLDLQKYIDWSFPVIDASTSTMKFYSHVKTFSKDQFKIQTPQDGVEVHSKYLDFMLIPAMAFSIHGDRLGRGKGYYDQFLKQLDVLKIGLQFQFNIFNQIPKEAHDIGVDFVVSDQFVFQTINNENNLNKFCQMFQAYLILPYLKKGYDLKEKN